MGPSVFWDGPCYHGMARPQVAMEEWPPIWRVAANILNKQPRIADKGGPPAWGLGEVLTTADRKNVSCCETVKE